ncbi:MAG: UDP-N-acetylglucosamine--N-acetylmuramyl-(pentapeptide) pyrophosphoryl-undecaprenol N-acetylglucosamine transferase [Fimbriimonadaceae bacterium]|jgi:UDP-N-acetylglucosamine--N-acetylmuramyl-(pentapeptide) pyrophosphoryl-undecaprenol N-acetylglucosamine transferase|nr:UDP-N-acetylglucosamine--N-acetylmuramyl-(pentapeptide) pyrophosphoryl-undecaprenol N-acetylglucosamine transferase [Fimbriimonadaceae bacterium]
MRLIVTGGGTGGHVLPAVEVAVGAKARGWDVRYFGSERGQERGACERAMLPFSAFASEPVYRPFTPKGLRSLARLLKATQLARGSLESVRPDVIFATGGYAAAPILIAAKKLKLTTIIHEQNTVPGRTNRLNSKHAFAVCTVFHGTTQHFPGVRVERTGMPVRTEMRMSHQGRLLIESPLASAVPMVLVMGGSQGSAALNDLALSTAVRMAKGEVQWLHLTGHGHYESTMKTMAKMAVTSDYQIKSYVQAEEMASAMFNCSVAVCRSGAGTLAELAAFRKPSVLIPYPHAFGQHQHTNAMEFVEMGAADLVGQEDISPADLEARIHSWNLDHDRRKTAEQALADWDVPDSVDRILSIIMEASGRKQETG